MPYLSQHSALAYEELEIPVPASVPMKLPLLTSCSLSMCLIMLPVVQMNSRTLADDVETWLQKPVIDPQLPWQEVLEFCESRVPPMPQVKNVPEWEKYAAQARQRVLEQVVFKGEAANWRDAEYRVEFLDTI